MTVFNKQQWFDSCAADATMVLALAVFFCGGIAYIGWTWRRLGSAMTGLMITGAMFLVIMIIVLLVRPFPPEIVRLTVIDTQLEVRRCHVWSDEIQTYPVADVEFRYERDERGSKRIVHHLLTMRRRGHPDRLGAIEFLPEYRFDFGALRPLAPAALSQYELARQTTSRR